MSGVGNFYVPTHHPPVALEWRESGRLAWVSSLGLGVSVRGSLPAWDICWGGSSGPFLSARIAYLQDKLLEGRTP